MLTFWMFAEELAQVTDAGKQGYSNLRTIMRTAYDFGSRFGMDFASDNSYSAIVDINICSMFCATPSALDDYMDKKAVEGGNITRTVLCQLEDQIGADGAMFRPYTPEQLQTINGTLDRMMADVYTPEGALRDEMLLDTSWIERDVRRWCQQKGREALQSGSAALDVFRKRASVSAFRIMALCYYLYSLEMPHHLIPASEPESPKPFDASRYERFFERPWLSNEASKFLFEERHLDPRVVRYCQLTSWKDRQGVPWLQIPYYNRQGHLIGIQNRNLIKGGSPRFRFPSGAACSIYNLPVLNLLKPGEPLFLTEGCSDCWAMLSSGHKAIAIPSATLLTKKDKDLLLSLSSSLSLTFHMFPDRDEPGERLFMQLQKVLPSLVRHDLPVNCKDFSDYYLQKHLEP